MLSVWPATSTTVFSYSTEYLADRVQHVEKRRAQVRAVGREGHIAGHVERNVVADARNADARALELGTQRGFLAVLVIANRATGQRADAGKYQRTLTALDGVVTGDKANDGAGCRTDQGAFSGLAGFFFTRVRIQRLTAAL